jgi:hypothetical protein
MHIRFALKRVLTSPATRAHASAPPAAARRGVTQSAVPSAIATQLDDLGNVFLVLELCDAVVFPDMLDEGLDVTTHCVQVGVTRAKYA